MNFNRKLPIPMDVKMEYPVTESMEQIKNERDKAIRSVFEGSLDKFILVIGPCSADHREPVLEYIEDDDEYEAVADAIDEYLDGCEFDELVEEE